MKKRWGKPGMLFFRGNLVCWLVFNLINFRGNYKVLLALNFCRNESPETELFHTFTTFSFQISSHKLHFPHNQMASNKTKPKENPINAAVSLLQSAEHCQHAHLAVEKIRTIVKDYFPANSAVKRKLDAHLRPLSQALPLISRAVKARATLCAPPKSNPSYARARLQSASTSPTSSGTEKLQALVRDSAPILPTPRKLYK